MSFYKLLLSEDEDLNVICCKTEDHLKYSIDTNFVYKGSLVENWSNEFTFYYEGTNDDVFLDVITSDISWLLVSPKVQDILSAVDKSYYQLLPVLLKDVKTGKINDQYKVLNVVKFCDALNFEKSLYKESKARGKSVYFIRKHVFNDCKIRGIDLFKIPQTKRAIFISQSLKNKFQSEAVTGIEYLEIDLI